jgi:nucleoside phosphorylase
MQSEAEPFLALGQVEPVEVGFPSASRFVKWSYGKAHCLVVIAGVSAGHGCDRIGQVAAAVMAREALILAPSSCLVSAGTCGAVASNLRVGDVIAAKSPATFYDHRIPLEEFASYADGGYSLFDLSPLLPPSTHRARVSTGSSLDMSERDANHLERLDIAAKEMELAAIAQVACELGGRGAGLKVVANAAGDQAYDEFVENLELVSQNLAFALKHLITNTDQPTEFAS